MLFNFKFHANHIFVDLTIFLVVCGVGILTSYCYYWCNHGLANIVHGKNWSKITVNNLQWPHGNRLGSCSFGVMRMVFWLSQKQDTSKWASIKGTIWTRSFQAYYTWCATNLNEAKFQQEAHCCFCFVPCQTWQSFWEILKSLTLLLSNLMWKSFNKGG